MWRWISSWQPEVKIHSIIAQERRQCSAEWDLKSIFVHYNTFSKLLHIPKKNEGAAVALFKPRWSLKLFGFCLCTISSLLVSHQQTCKPKSCYKKSSSFSSSSINYHKLYVKLANITAFHFSNKATDSSKAAFLKPQGNDPRAQNVIYLLRFYKLSSGSDSALTMSVTRREVSKHFKSLFWKSVEVNRHLNGRAIHGNLPGAVLQILSSGKMSSRLTSLCYTQSQWTDPRQKLQANVSNNIIPRRASAVLHLCTWF